MATVVLTQRPLLAWYMTLVACPVPSQENTESIPLPVHLFLCNYNHAEASELIIPLLLVLVYQGMKQ